jgi:hypothetical protein
MPSYLAARGHGNRDFAFRFRDGEGVPSAGGARFHGGVDWFAPGNTPIRAPGAGRIVRSEPSGDRDGQVFGGVLAIEQADGITWTMRHVDPKAAKGSRVEAGDVVAAVTDWNDGPDHLHLEVWRTFGGGYRFENMIDPFSVTWGDSPDLEPFYFEEMPHDRGGSGPVRVWHGRSRTGAARAERTNRDLGRTVTTVRGDDGVFHVLWWAGSTAGTEFRFGGWAQAATRDLKRTARESSTGRRMRAFKGRMGSLYPWPAGATA